MEVVHEFGLLLGQRDLERLKSLGSNDPGADGGGKVLCTERSKRNVLPDLQITGTPIVKENVSEDVVFSIVALDGVSEIVSFSDNGSHLKLKIETVGLGPRGVFNLSLAWRRSNLTLGSANGSAIENDRGSTSMVSNGQVSPVRLEGVVRSSEHASNIVSVVL